MECQLEHIGYITDDILKTASSFRLLGYEAWDGETTIELVEPYEDNKSMQKMLKRGVTPYHTCYTVQDIMTAYEEMLDNDFTPLFKPVAAPAFGGRKICYFFKQEVGLVELVSRI